MERTDYYNRYNSIQQKEYSFLLAIRRYTWDLGNLFHGPCFLCTSINFMVPTLSTSCAAAFISRGFPRTKPVCYNHHTCIHQHCGNLIHGVTVCWSVKLNECVRAPNSSLSLSLSTTTTNITATLYSTYSFTTSK